MRPLLLILGLLCLGVSIVGLFLYSRPNQEVVYGPPVQSTPQPIPSRAPTKEPTPVPGPMTVIQTEAGKWDVFVPESGRWFDTRIPVIINQEIYINCVNRKNGQFTNPNLQVKFGGKTLGNNPGNYFSYRTFELCDSGLPFDLRDTIKLRIEPNFGPELFSISVSHYTASNCALHSDGSEQHSQTHRALIAWWNEKAALLGRQ